MEKFFDSAKRRLVFIQEQATPSFWDRQWEDQDLKKYVCSLVNERFVYPTTQKYLPRGSKILEGGCGKGQFVYSLEKRGYDAYGIDFAQNIIHSLTNIFPESKFEYGDVRNLPYQNDFFDGYWSLGVIEHFPDGYDDILKEMSRVLKPGGYLFLTFPHMSKLRRTKAKLGKYTPFSATEDWKGNFYQFALLEETVLQDLKKLGLQHVKSQPFEGLKGLKDEVHGTFASFLRYIYTNDMFLVKVVRYMLARLLAPFSSHAILLVCKKDSYV